MHAKRFPPCGGSTLDRYTIRLYAKAYRDIDEIYAYIAENLQEPDIAESMVARLEDAISSLECFPKRGAIRKIGSYANQDYRQLFVKNFTIVYRILEEKGEVHIVTVRYTPSSF